MTALRRGRWRADWAVIALAALSIAASTGWTEPPRFDGAGYFTLARALASGQGYRAIDHPDRPPQVNFPPGYPALLALLCETGAMPFARAHLLSVACGIVATWLAFRWYRRQLPPRAALPLGLALGANWITSRTFGEIQSEPLYLLLQALALLGTERLVSARGRSATPSAIAVGGLLGLAALTRNVALVLILAVATHLLWSRFPRAAVVSTATATLVVAPWIAWQAVNPAKKQIAYFLDRSPLETLLGNALFYARRLPDMLTGPFVEVATVFDPRFAGPATLVALLISLLIVSGWCLALPQRRSRLAALLGLGTLGLLLLWPFTEAGRFLIPLIPALLLGAHGGLALVLRRLGIRRNRTRAAWLLLLAALPYSSYGIVTQRAAAQRALNDPFDSACAWLTSHAEPGDILLTAYPGEAFLQTGLRGLAPDASANVPALESLIRQRPGIRFLLVAPRRFANPPDSPLVHFTRDRPERVRLVFGDPATVAVYQLIRPPGNASDDLPGTAPSKPIE